ncbi:FliI/YscN family ATPase [Enterovibrio norvegicus]|uniref:FliI/YscN family ATPase n=1 Tax=Enterovibrio norvegicus TaxID=188144 RepID=UPI0013D4F10B|nr:FliI/YscN family ATPase [Enterovibrio norvegicus]
MQFDQLLSELTLGVSEAHLSSAFGKVTSIKGGYIQSTHHNCSFGESVRVGKADRSLECEVISVDEKYCLLAPLRSIDGLSINDPVSFSGKRPQLTLLHQPFGKILDGFGDVVSDEESPFGERQALFQEPVSPIYKESLSEQLTTGSPIIDNILPLCKGQKVGVFAGSGVGKSTLLNKLYTNVDADVKIYVMIGERSREIVDFYQSEMASKDQNKKTILIASSTEDSPVLKKRAVYIAMAYAGRFSQAGKSVAVVIDSITRLAHAMREIGISRGELPVARGYPPSVFSELSRLVELGGNFKNQGSITTVMSILVDGDDVNEPISDYLRGVLDGHYVLDRKLANLGYYPSINILKSRSRTMGDVFNRTELEFERRVREIYGEYHEVEDIVKTGIYQKGSNAGIDEVIDLKKSLDSELYTWPGSVSKALREKVDAFTQNHQD